MRWDPHGDSLYSRVINKEPGTQTLLEERKRDFVRKFLPAILQDRGRQFNFTVLMTLPPSSGTKYGFCPGTVSEHGLMPLTLQGFEIEQKGKYLPTSTKQYPVMVTVLRELGINQLSIGLSDDASRLSLPNLTMPFLIEGIVPIGATEKEFEDIEKAIEFDRRSLNLTSFLFAAHKAGLNIKQLAWLVLTPNSVSTSLRKICPEIIEDIQPIVAQALKLKTRTAPSVPGLPSATVINLPFLAKGKLLQVGVSYEEASGTIEVDTTVKSITVKQLFIAKGDDHMDKKDVTRFFRLTEALWRLFDRDDE
ncbi:MAG: hypothetical protein WCP97_05795 [bacterium]